MGIAREGKTVPRELGCRLRCLALWVLTPFLEIHEAKWPAKARCQRHIPGQPVFCQENHIVCKSKLPVQRPYELMGSRYNKVNQNKTLTAHTHTYIHKYVCTQTHICICLVIHAHSHVWKSTHVQAHIHIVLTFSLPACLCVSTHTQAYTLTHRFLQIFYHWNVCFQKPIPGFSSWHFLSGFTTGSVIVQCCK